MKNTLKILVLCTTFFFAYPSDASAQKKRNRVSKHIKRHHKIKKAKHISRHRYGHLPKHGKVVIKLGVGAVNINFKGTKLFVHNGVWYKPTSKRNRFVVVKAPLGIRIHRIPLPNRPKIIINKNVYYYYYGTYYEDKAGSEEMIVVKAPIGAKIDALPEGYDTVVVNDVTYYRFDGVHYNFIENSDNDAYFIVTKTP